MRGLLWIPGLVGVAILAAALDDDSGLGTWWSLRGDLHEARERIEEGRSLVERLEIDAEALEAGGFAEERAIREDLDWARPGETIVRLGRADPSTPRSP